MKIHYDMHTGKVTGYTLTGTAPAGSLDLGDGVDFNFLYDFDEYEVINGDVVHVGASAEKLEILELQRKQDITDEATRIIEAKYSPLKQIKLLSIAVSLQDKVIQGGTLTADEEAMMQMNRDANSWITGIRTIENSSITNGTALADIIW